VVDSKQEQIAFLRSFPLLSLSLTFLLGIVFASIFQATLWIWCLLFGLAAASFTFLRRRVSSRTTLLLLAASLLFIGAARFQIAQPRFDDGDLAFYNDLSETVEVRGLVVKPPTLQDTYTELRLRAQEISMANTETHPLDGLLLARVNLGQDWQYGDRVLLRGELQTPPEFEDFSYRDYLARQGIHSLMSFASAEKLEINQGNPFWAVLYGLRQRSEDLLYRLYPDPEASLFAGILLGDESGLSDSLKTAFNDTGTRHIIAISGFNISIIAGLFLMVFSHWVGMRRGAWLAALGIGLYTLLVGAEASVVRAAIMGLLALLARQVGRQSFALNTLVFTAALMALFNPLLLWDIGFQLSFAATLGLVLYADRIKARTDDWMAAHLSKNWARRLSSPLNEYVVFSLAAQITTLPLLLFYFERFSWFSLPVNLLILPVQPALMVLGGASVLLGLMIFPLGSLLSFLGWPLAAYTIRIVEAFAAIPWVSQNFSSFSLGYVFFYYGFLLFVTFPALRPRFDLKKIHPSVDWPRWQPYAYGPGAPY